MQKTGGESIAVRNNCKENGDNGMRYKAVIFDLDGTLLNTIEDLADSMNAVLARYGYPTHDIQSYKYFIGSGIRNLVYEALPPEKRDEAIISTCMAGMKEEYGKRWADKTRPYDGIPELLDALAVKNIKLSVLSNKPHEMTKLAVEKLLSKWTFDAVYGERAGVPRKPDPAAALEISKALGIPPHEFLYVGDSGIDMKTANSSGMYAVGVLWGFRSAEELQNAGAKTLIKKPLDLLTLL